MNFMIYSKRDNFVQSLRVIWDLIYLFDGLGRREDLYLF